MARPIEYDLDKVLDNAMEIFWQKGYAGVSMDELVKCTGLNRRSMYSLFNDKNGLFKDALEHYYRKRGAYQLKILKENPGKKGIELFFERFGFGDKFKGCLYSNSMREKEFVLEETYDILKKYFGDICAQLEENLKQAKDMGEFSGDAKAMALTLVTLIHGFHVHGKYNSSQEDGKAIIQNVLDLIR
jgi:TetR/AcrR family transcriptional repressor of nem operon